MTALDAWGRLRRWLSAIALGGLCTASLAQAPIEWIDVHVHLIGGGGVRSDFAGAARAAIAAMDEVGIRTSVVLPPPQVQEQDPRGRHDFGEYRDSLKRYPGRFAFLGGGGTLNPILIQAGRDSVVSPETRAQFERLAREIIAAGAAGFGEITAHHLSHAPGHPYESVAADHPLLRLLADIAAEHDVVIDLHFDAVLHDMSPPPRFESPPNPRVLKANFAAFERLLAHNRKAKIIWAHAGSDPLGFWTPALSRELLARHPNLYMSLRFPARMATSPRKPYGAEGMMKGPTGWPKPVHFAMTGPDSVNPQWIELIREFPERFVLGGDQFIASPSLQGAGPGLTFAKLSPIQREMTRKFLAALPPDVARKVGIENATRLYKLGVRP